MPFKFLSASEYFASGKFEIDIQFDCALETLIGAVMAFQKYKNYEPIKTNAKRLAHEDDIYKFAKQFIAIADKKKAMEVSHEI